MLYTTQQLTGGPKYSNKVKIGNWQEDMELEEIKNNDTHSSSTGFNQSTAIETGLKNAKKRVPQTYSEDGLLRFGDHVMMSNKKTTGVLVMNILDKFKGYDEAYGVTTTTTVFGPNARNIVSLQRYEERDGFEGNDVHYGQKIKLACNSSFHKRPLLLHS
jgi:hypothetical protein